MTIGLSVLCISVLDLSLGILYNIMYAQTLRKQLTTHVTYK